MDASKLTFVGDDGSVPAPGVTRVCRLVTGELVIAEVTHVDNGDYTFVDPVMFEIVKSPQGTGIRAGSLIPLGSPGDSISINAIQIQFWFNQPSSQLLDKYAEMRSPIDTKGGIIH